MRSDVGCKKALIGSIEWKDSYVTKHEASRDCCSILAAFSHFQPKEFGVFVSISVFIAEYGV